MLPGQKGFSSKSVAPELDIQKIPQHTVADEKARSNENIPASATAVAQFRFRILVVDDELSIRETITSCSFVRAGTFRTFGDYAR